MRAADGSPRAALRSPGRSRALALGAALGAAGALALLGPGTAGAAKAPKVRAPTAKLAWVGHVLMPTVARRAPNPRARRVMTIRPLGSFSKGSTTVLVTGVKLVGRRQWVQVLLARRPNGSRGWVPADSLDLATTPYRVVIDVSARRLTLYRSGRAYVRVPVAVGKRGTPTPLGRRFAIAETVRTYEPGAFLGPIVLPLTGFSERLNEFDGGDGRVAIHGTSLPALIGKAVSHGCIRMTNANIKRVARRATPGTPVWIVR